MTSPLQLGTADTELPDRTTAPHGNGVAVPDIGEVRPLPTGRENIGQEQNLLVCKAVRNNGGADIGKGNAHILRLAAGITPCQVGVAEETCRRVAEHLL